MTPKINNLILKLPMPHQARKNQGAAIFVKKLVMVACKRRLTPVFLKTCPASLKEPGELFRLRLAIASLELLGLFSVVSRPNLALNVFFSHLHAKFNVNAEQYRFERQMGKMVRAVVDILEFGLRESESFGAKYCPVRGCSCNTRQWSVRGCPRAT